MRFQSRWLLALLAVVLVARHSIAQELKIAAAADLQFAMADLAAQFEKRAGGKLDVTYGSSVNFLSQIENGAPFDLFFSADSEYPKKLATAGVAEAGTL